MAIKRRFGAQTLSCLREIYLRSVVRSEICRPEAIKLHMQENCTLDIDDAEVYLIPQRQVAREHSCQLKSSCSAGMVDSEQGEAE